MSNGYKATNSTSSPNGGSEKQVGYGKKGECHQVGGNEDLRNVISPNHGAGGGTVDTKPHVVKEGVIDVSPEDYRNK